MKSVHDILRQRILDRAGLLSPAQPKLILAKLERSEWCERFEVLMRNRLIMGALRYGPLGAVGKPQFDRFSSIIKRAGVYRNSGNQELLVDIANLALVEFVEGVHPNKHFAAGDDGDHVTRQ